MWVRGHSVPFETKRECGFLFAFFSNQPWRCLVSFARYCDLLVEYREIFIPHLYLVPPQRWPCRNFAKMFDTHKTIMIRPVCDKKLRQQSFWWNTGMTDSPTEKQTEVLYRYRASVCWGAIKTVSVLWEIWTTEQVKESIETERHWLMDCIVRRYCYCCCCCRLCRATGAFISHAWHDVIHHTIRCIQCFTHGPATRYRRLLSLQPKWY